ncbi:hypothetical protein [Pseudomonas phage D6]|nr:hypothetical protein [Pseudomonas phage D6]
MWGGYLVAFVIFVLGAGIFFSRRADYIDADDIGRSHKDEKFPGLVMMLVAVLICIWI